MRTRVKIAAISEKISHCRNIAARITVADVSCGHEPHHNDLEEQEMKKLLMSLWREESGQDLIEYGLLIGIITLAARCQALGMYNA